MANIKKFEQFVNESYLDDGPNYDNLMITEDQLKLIMDQLLIEFADYVFMDEPVQEWYAMQDVERFHDQIPFYIEAIKLFDQLLIEFSDYVFDDEKVQHWWRNNMTRILQ